jgi:hypothetical protein
MAGDARVIPSLQERDAPASIPAEYGMLSDQRMPADGALIFGELDEGPARDDLRANVVRKYKSRIQELSQTLERSQNDLFQQKREVEDLRRSVMEKDELLRAQRETMSRLTAKLEEGNVQSNDTRRELWEAQQQVRALQHQLTDRDRGGPDSHTSLRIADSLREDVARLTKELATVRTERDNLLVRGPASGENSSELVREMKLQLIEKDAKIQAMESQCASLKRSSVIQAVELQELHDHLAGLEKQKNLQEIQRFPPLPPLSSIKESPYEQYEDEDGKMRAIMLADEALHNAQQEIAILKQSDERRQQLEGMLNNSNKEVAMLRESLAAAQQGRGVCVCVCL